MAGSEKLLRGKRVLTDRTTILKGASAIEMQDVTVAFEDFIGKMTVAMSSDVGQYGDVLINQAAGATGVAAQSASAGGAAGQAGHGGWLAGASDDIDADLDEIALGSVPWIIPARAGNGMAVCEIGFVMPAITARQHFFGFTDDETEGTGTNGSLNVQSALTVVDVATDACGFIFSSLATTADRWKYANTKNNTQMTNAVQASFGGTTFTAVIDEYCKLRVELDSSGNAYLYGMTAGAATGGRSIPVETVATVASAVTSTVALLPLFTAAATTTTAVDWEIDYMFGSCRG